LNNSSQNLVHAFESYGDCLLSPFEILQSQTACTEIRGGQAGGISCIEFDAAGNMSTIDDSSSSENKALIHGKHPRSSRVRCVARKRYPLATDLVNLLRNKMFGWFPVTQNPKNTTATYLGHTRFATASINKVSELHPHGIHLKNNCFYLFIYKWISNFFTARMGTVS
jgi:hypothetical protein